MQVLTHGLPTFLNTETMDKVTSAQLQASKQVRRTVRSLSVQEKVQAIDRVHDGESKASVARDLGVPESTLRGWCKGEEKLRGIVARSAGNTSQSSCEELTEQNELIQLKPDVRDMTTKIGQEGLLTGKRMGTDTNYQGPRKYPKFDNCDAASDVKNRYSPGDSPINLHRHSETNGIGLHRNLFANGGLLSKDVNGGSLPALAAITSAINSKTQMLYNSYIKQQQQHQPLPPPTPPETTSKPLDLTKLNTLPRPDMNEAVMYWLQAQREQVASPIEGKTPDSSSWFWKWYKNYGVPPPPVTSTTNNDKTSVNSEKTPSEDEDEVPATPGEAVRHGEKFLRWLECCSDPSITALQLLQFRYLLNNVKKCADRKSRQITSKPKARRK